MNSNKLFQKLGVFSLVLGVGLLSSQWDCDAFAATQQEQQQSQSQQPPPPPSPTPPPSSQPAVSDPKPPVGELPVKRRKVWTNDEVVVLRTPADSYQVDKEAKQAADAEAAAKEAAYKAVKKSEKEPLLDIKLPATPEETQKMLKSTQDDIQEETIILNKLLKELLDAPPEEQAEKQKEINRITASLETLRRNVKALQDHLQSFSEKPQVENPPVAPQPPPA